jgi:hypothetical protein
MVVLGLVMALAVGSAAMIEVGAVRLPNSADTFTAPTPTTDPMLRTLPNGGSIWDQGDMYWLPPGTVVRVLEAGRARGRPEHAPSIIERAVVVSLDVDDPHCAEAQYQWKHASRPTAVLCALLYMEGLVAAD